MTNVHRHGTVIKTRGHVATPATTATVDVGTTTVTAPNGMSWTFAGTHVNGTYINGDPWIYTTSTLAMPTLSTPATGTGATARNGGMINPTFNTLVESSPYGNSYTTSMKQGFDGRAEENVATGHVPVLDYNEAYNAHLSAATLSPGDSLVSCESLDQTQFDLITSNKRSIWKMACVTVVNYIPETDEFRPPYFGTTKTRWRWSDLNLGLLPNLTPASDPKGVTSDDWHIDEDSLYFAAPSSDLPVLTRNQEMRNFALRDLQWFICPQWSSRGAYSLLRPAAGQEWYPRDGGRSYGRLACYVLHDFDDRDTHLKSIIQVAIDAYAVASGHFGGAPWSTGAGFFSGPLWFIRFAGLLFDDADMKDAANLTTGNTDYYGDPVEKWGEQMRVFYSATAADTYLLPTGYTGDYPLWGDRPFADTSSGQPSNGTFRYPGVNYDIYPYREQPASISGGGFYGTVAANSANTTTLKLDAGSAVDDAYNGLTIVGIIDGSEEETTITDYVGATKICTVSPAFSANPDTTDKFIIYTAAYPNILDSTYVQLPDANSPGRIGSYMSANHFSHMGNFMASVIMGDEAFWGGAVADFDRRYANDCQMWEGWGVYFDYSDILSKTFKRDVQGFGGTGNGWMADLWDAIS